TYREGYAPSGMTRENWEYIVTSVFFVFIAVAASIFVFSGMQAAKYNVKDFKNGTSGASEGNSESKSEKIIGAVSGTIMIVATCIFLLLGFLKNIWHPSWVVFPIGGMLCGIVSIIVKAIFGEK
ncbi:MAG: hypothetical protein ACI3XX_05835, partial [Eubacteriales bacterium]